MALNFDYYGNNDGRRPRGCRGERDTSPSVSTRRRGPAPADANREKALIAARGIIDSLNYKGIKHSVYTLCGSSDLGRREDDIRAAEASQPLEFPRGDDTTVPEAIRIAEYEIAYALLDGKDPELELENLAISAMGYGAVKTSYERSQLPIEHIINMVPSSVAWRLLRPFLRDSDALKLSRLS